MQLITRSLLSSGGAAQISVPCGAPLQRISAFLSEAVPGMGLDGRDLWLSLRVQRFSLRQVDPPPFRRALVGP